MIASMTAFGQGKFTAQCGVISVEIKAVNSRYLDLSFRLPEELRQLEPGLRELIGKSIKRGKVEIRAALENALQNLPTKPSAAILEQQNCWIWERLLKMLFHSWSY